MTSLTENVAQSQATQKWHAYINAIYSADVALIGAQEEVELTEKMLELFEIATLLPELLKAKDDETNKINGGNEAVRKMQTQTFLNTDTSYTELRKRQDKARRALRTAQMELEHNKRMERFWRVQCGWQAQS